MGNIGKPDKIRHWKKAFEGAQNTCIFYSGVLELNVAKADVVGVAPHGEPLDAVRVQFGRESKRVIRPLTSKDAQGVSYRICSRF